MARIDRSCDGAQVSTLPAHFKSLMTGSDEETKEICIIMLLDTDLGPVTLSFCRLCAKNLKDCLDTAIKSHPELMR
jgi:hypothetical protein